MTIALDIGASAIRSLRRDGRRLIGRKIPAVYLAMPKGDAQRRLLEASRHPFVQCDDSFLVIGEHAVELSNSMRLPLIPVLPTGRLPEDDPIGRQVAGMILESLIPPRGPMAGTAAVILPGNAGNDPRQAADPLLGFVERLLRLRGYRLSPQHSGRAAVLAELENHGFSGISLVVGSATTTLALVQHGELITECTVRRGCDSVDEAFARSRGRFLFDSSGERYLDTAAVARWRIADPIDLSAPRTADEDSLLTLCREWLATCLREISDHIHRANVARSLQAALPLVISGGPARMTGFDQLVVECLHRVQFPLRIREVRIGKPNDFTLARGCLIAAELEAGRAARSA